MYKGTITWSSGKKREFECEDVDKFFETQFGHPTRFPDGVEVKYALVKEEKSHPSEVKEVAKAPVAPAVKAPVAPAVKASVAPAVKASVAPAVKAPVAPVKK
jgi:hypothetical protein